MTPRTRTLRVRFSCARHAVIGCQGEGVGVFIAANVASVMHAMHHSAPALLGWQYDPNDVEKDGPKPTRQVGLTIRGFASG